ncbi:8788_t:CDS:10 [Entrophospora sp. SA101]|nr:8773_t:CDS:10 [Entrophospora sp. SA101]CAJ0832137.1 8778_t:CDS:10 [Entrophospora sp. SA101]CAJ0832163.1 8788_t:CDS:10 [Entrophospora sp. SA101]
MSSTNEFENTFEDLLHKPTINSISDTLSDVDVSNPFHDTISSLIAPEKINEETDFMSEYSSSINNVFANDISDPLEKFENIEVSSTKDLDVIASFSIQSQTHEETNNYEELYNQFDGSENGLNPIFEISVEDPQKIGDPINARIVYKTSSKDFKSNDFTVLRRYRDFLWLYNQLTLGNPGVIVPPLPEKHAMGRFQDEFIENRRQALEKCLNKIISHPNLYKDRDLKIFLESDNFNIDVVRRNEEPKGVLKSLGEAVSNVTAFNKFTEMDDWFEGRKNQLDILESQLKTLLKSAELVVRQQKDLGGSAIEFGDSLFALSDVEVNKPLANNLSTLGKLQQKIRELHIKQARQDVLTLENTIEEYIRIIGSIKVALNSRTKVYQNWQSAMNDLQKKKLNYERSKSQNRLSQERLSYMLAIIAEGENKVEDCRHEFEDVTKLIKAELDRFDKEKVEDFKNSIESFLDSIIKTKNEIIKLWESFYQEIESHQSF